MSDAARAKVRFRLIQFLDDAAADALLDELEAEQTAALREENARLEEERQKWESACMALKVEPDLAIQAVIVAQKTKIERFEQENARLRGRLGYIDEVLRKGLRSYKVEQLVDIVTALLADPEGQRVGEEWRALIDAARGVLRDSDRLDPDGVTWPELRKAVAAVERARQAP